MTVTVPTDVLPPRTSLAIGVPSFGAGPVYVSSNAPLSLSAVDDALVVGDGTGVGAAATYVSLDSAPYAVYASSFTLAAPGPHAVAFYSVDFAGNVEVARSSAVYVDVFAPALALTPPSGSTVTVSTPTLYAVYADTASGVSTATVRLSLDGASLSTAAVVTASSATFVPVAALAQGTHTFVAAVADDIGNVALTTSTFFLDSIPPVTTLLVDGLPAGSTSLVLITTDTVGFVAVDSGTGVAETLYALNGGSRTAYAAPFSLGGGTYTLAYQSVDAAGNAESTRTATAFVIVAASSGALSAQLVYPWPSSRQVETAVGGTVDVRGRAAGTNLRAWTLAAAPGVGATKGFGTLASGAAAVDGALAAWDTGRLSGFYTLSLSASDAHGGVAASTATVFVGAPVIDDAIGARDANVILPALDDPEGLVIRPDGKLWVASDDGNRLLLITSSGTLIATVGTGGIKFDHPRGMSLDAVDELYVADRDDDRVVKLSADGSALLATLSQGLSRPEDAAVDVDGSVYVADTGNGRVRVFSSSGTVLRDIQVGAKSRPWGVALSAAGLWVSDLARHAAYLYTRTGTLLQTVPSAGRVRGDAVDRAQALYAADREVDLIEKFDPDGSPLLDFGSRGLTRGEDRARLRFLSDPADAAIAPDGSLWVADAGHDRVVRYVLPDPGEVCPAFKDEDERFAGRGVDPVDGGKVERDDGVSVRVPPGALNAPLGVTVGDAVLDADRMGRARAAQRMAGPGGPVEFGPTGTQFATPVTLTFPYDPAAVASMSLSEDELSVAYWDPLGGSWELLASTVDKNAKTVSAQTSHFSVYQVMGSGVQPHILPPGADVFGLRTHYAFPNPSNNGAAVDLRLETGLADAADLRVYNQAGRRVLSVSLNTVNIVTDPTLGPQDAYDYSWNVGGIGSGVYTYVFVAHKSGEHDVVATGKVGVIK